MTKSDRSASPETRVEDRLLVTIAYRVLAPAAVVLGVIFPEDWSAFWGSFLFQMAAFWVSSSIVNQVVRRAREFPWFRAPGLLVALSLFGVLLVDIRLLAIGFGSNNALGAAFYGLFSPIFVLPYAAAAISLVFVGITLFVWGICGNAKDRKAEVIRPAEAKAKDLSG